MNLALDSLTAWRREVVESSGFRCTPIPFAESREWRWQDGFLRHRTGGFFAVGGLRVRSRRPELDGREQLILLQPETAINGFLVRRAAGGVEVLFQGRVEPGNVEAMQLAPTVQSTEANYKRLHGGGATAFLEWFTEARAPIVYDELQSEEATRYYGKYNRNVVVDVTGLDVGELPPTFRWFDVDEIASFAVASNVLNTDARSVLSGLDWGLLRERPFDGHDDGTFGAELRRSFCADPAVDDDTDAELLAWLTRLRVRSSPRHEVLPVDGLANWVVEDDVVREREPELGFCVRQFRVEAAGREVRAWDQPLIDSAGVGRLTLVLQRRGGALRFLVKASHEIGFLEGVQCAASITVVPGERPDDADPVERALREAIEDGAGAATLARCRQSEEGGRFYRDENDYEVVLLDPGVAVPDSPLYRWLTLAQVRRLVGVPGTFAMEFRGVLALLLHWL